MLSTSSWARNHLTARNGKSAGEQAGRMDDAVDRALYVCSYTMRCDAMRYKLLPTPLTEKGSSVVDKQIDQDGTGSGALHAPFELCLPVPNATLLN